MSIALEMRPSPLSLVDGFGTVFLGSGRVFRAIRPEAAIVVEDLLRSGLLQRLENLRLVPRTWRSNVDIPGYAFVLEHEAVPVVSYPYEWSYGMLRDAASLVLEINEIAQSFGWELKDTHGFNVLFDGPRPLYVDIGSFVRSESGGKGWIAFEDYVRFYHYPLSIWRDGAVFVARRLVASNNLMSHGDYGLCRWAWVRWGGYNVYHGFLKRWYQFRRLTSLPDSKIRTRLSGSRAALVCALKQSRWMPFQRVPYQRIRNKLRIQSRRRGAGSWSSYQNAGSSFITTARFRRIIDLLRAYKVASVLELAANQGWLSETLLKEGVVKRAICTDSDELAVDRAFERTKETQGSLDAAVLDFINPMVSPFGDHPSKRYRSEAVLALAVSHHVLLGQNIPLVHFFSRVASYSARLVMIEFMPLGLWDGTSAPPYPAWYNVDTFRNAFSESFKLDHEESLEENRYLLCGFVRDR